MTKDEILSMARYIFDVAADGRGRETFSGDSFDIERFAALVAEKEREECAKVCDERAQDDRVSNHRRCDADKLSRAIRERGQKEYRGARLVLTKDGVIQDGLVGDK
jgi:hypothetical protein